MTNFTELQPNMKQNINEHGNLLTNTNFRYGGGLHIGNPDLSKEYNSTLDDFTVFMGHVGHTYGFESRNGFFPHINVSFSLISTNDYYSPKNAFCLISQVIFNHHIDTIHWDLHCNK